jgi:folate-binding protein YgfZ
VTTVASSDYDLVTRAAGLVDRSDRGKVLLTGAEAAEFLEGQVTNEVEALAPGSGCYAAFLSHKGKMRGDLRILRGHEWIWIDTERIALPGLLHLIQMYSIGRDVRHEDVTEARALLSLIGPAAGQALDVAPPADDHAWVEGEHGMYVRTDLGIDVICAAHDADGVRAALGVDAVTEDVAECVRVERGRPRFGLEMTSDTIPEEAGINDRAVSFTKGCYVGQETVARLHYKGKPNRHLRGLRLSAPAERGDAIRLGEREVGSVGTACVSPRLGSIALAVLRREAQPGDTVAVGAEAIPAEVVEPPFAQA